MDPVLGLVGGWLGAAEHARGAARRVEDVADALRALARRVAAAEEVRWRSAAAQAFRERAGELAGDLRRCAGDVDAAAAALRAHAAVTAERAERIAGLARAAERASDDGLEEAADRARRAVRRSLPGPFRLP